MSENLNISGTYKIAELISSVMAVATGGQLDGIMPGMLATVFERGRPIKDPDSGEYLGDLELVKAAGIVGQVNPRFCVINARDPREFRNISVGDLVRYCYGDDVPF